MSENAVWPFVPPAVWFVTESSSFAGHGTMLAAVNGFAKIAAIAAVGLGTPAVMPPALGVKLATPFEKLMMSISALEPQRVLRDDVLDLPCRS